MFTRKLLVVGVAGALALLAQPAWSATTIENRSVEVIGAGATSDALIAVEANRTAIINRLVREHSATLFASAIPESSFRNALSSLRADQLLAASLVGSFSEVTAIVDQTSVDGASLQRYVAVAPTAMNAVQQLPAAEVFLVREGDTLSMVRANQLNATSSTQQLVGYFIPTAANSSVVIDAASPGNTRKDGPGTGANSWIGFTAGNNQASGPGSAVAAGTFNLASGQGSFVGAGTSNQANGISSLVLGGFDNRAVAIDSVVGGGAGHRATGARSVIMGGGYNLASGNFSFIGGGGRDGAGSGAAGTDVDRDHRAYGKWSFIGGGTGNVTGVNGSGDSIRSSAVVGGQRNTASGARAFIGAGGCNVASGSGSVVVGGGQSSDTNACTFGNIASGTRASVLGGLDNIAAGNDSVALGAGAQANDSNSFVFSDGTTYASNGADTFNVEATGGLYVSPSTRIQMGSQTRQNITLWGATDEYGLGVQTDTQYYRSGFNFAWFQGGAHDDNAFNPGVGGTRLLSLQPDSSMTFGNGATNGEFLKLNSANDRTIGSQNATLYFRTNTNFCWFRGGVHSNLSCNPGAGGTVAMVLSSGGLTVNGTFVSASDRNIKSSIQAVDSKSILAKVAALPISTWVYKADAGTRHIGPMAQDFKALFDVGVDDKTISMVDADGIALAAIKGLVEELQERDVRIASQQTSIDMQLTAIQSLRAQVSAQQQQAEAQQQQIGELAAGQLQMQEIAAVMAKMQRELASLRKEGGMASLAK